MSTNQDQLDKVRQQPGFIAALDQSGGSTPKALKLYGLGEDCYSNDDEMFSVVHEMRTRIVTSPSFNGDRIMGAILFENTMDREIDGIPSAQYLWEKKKRGAVSQGRQGARGRRKRGAAHEADAWSRRPAGPS